MPARPGAPLPHTARPNILWMIADDHRFDALGAAGDPVVRTPALDALAAGGVHFRRNYIMGGNSGAVCVPTRASILTGVNPLRAHVGSRPDGPPGAGIAPDLPTLPAVLRREGYRTFAIGKWHNDREGFARGFAGGRHLFFGGMSDHRRVPVHAYDPTGAYPPDARRIAEGFSSELFADAAIAFLRDQGAALDAGRGSGPEAPEPFCLYVAFTAPHDPRMAPSPYAEMYPPEAVPLPPNFCPDHPFDNGDLHTRDEELAPHPRTPETVRRHIADYYAMVSHLDAQVGRILAALRATGRDRDTIVVYTADHGLALGRHGLLGKQNLYDPSVRVPLILSGPGLPPGRRVEALSMSYDLFPTLCALTGTPVPATVEGRSLLPLATGAQAVLHESAWAMYRYLQRMVTDGRWKLIRYYRSERGGTDRLQLFDLQDDPWEMRDLSAEAVQAPRLRALAERLRGWQDALGDPLASVPVLPAG